jgi:hypothetical protein
MNDQRQLSAVNGSSAMWRAFFTARASMRWCLEQLPVSRRGRIFFCSLFSEQNWHTLGRRVKRLLR